MGRKRKSNKHLPERVIYREVNKTFYFLKPVDGKNKWLNLGKDFTSAMMEWAKLVEIDKSPVNMSDLMDEYICTIATQKATKTYKNYCQQIELLKKVFGHLKPYEITPALIYKFMDNRSAKVAANREKSLLSNVLKLAIRKGMITENPCREVDGHSEKKRDRYIEDTEFQFLHNETTNPLIRSMMEIGYLTALRKEDILDIKLAAIDHYLSVIPRKTRNSTRKKISFPLYDTEGKLNDLGRAIERSKSIKRKVFSLYLLSTRKGQKYTTSGFDSIWQRHRNKCAEKMPCVKDIHFHDIRAKALTDAERSGRHDTQLLAGHANRETTDGYIKQRKVEVVSPLNVIDGINL